MCNSTKKVTCPKCGTKNEIKIGKDNGDNVWETKIINCSKCRHPVVFKVNNHDNKIKLLSSRSSRLRAEVFR